jgi:hypothetical protein
MKTTFSKFILAPAVLAAAALAATSATAETTVNVPFKFTAAGKVCPAGSYTVRHDDNSSYVTLSRKGTSQNFMYILGPGAAEPTDGKIALNFDQVGGTHVLQSIQYGPQVTGRLDKKTLQDMERQSQLTGGR